MDRGDLSSALRDFAAVAEEPAPRWHACFRRLPRRRVPSSAPSDWFDDAEYPFADVVDGWTTGPEPVPIDVSGLTEAASLSLDADLDSSTFSDASSSDFSTAGSHDSPITYEIDEQRGLESSILDSHLSAASMDSPISDIPEQRELVQEEQRNLEEWGLPFDPRQSTSDEVFVDMRDVDRQRHYTALDFPRDHVAYWAELLMNDLDRGEDERILSDENRDRIIGLMAGEIGAQVPRVDEVWCDHHPAAGDYMGDRLVHHHWDGGPIAFAIPESVHHEFSGALHWLVLSGEEPWVR
jgi:HNH/Endo VII superfamily nuclease toxin with a HHH motif